MALKFSGFDMVFPSLLQRRSAILRSVFQGGVLLLAAGAAVAAGAFLAVTMPLPGAVSPQEGRRLLGDWVKSGFQYQITRPVNVLVMGIDGVPGAKEGSDAMFTGRSDTMLLIHMDPTEPGGQGGSQGGPSVSMLSIPRDTQVDVPSVGITKINQANASGGPLLVGQTVSGALNGVNADRYVRVSTNAFRELVDMLGGVRINVPFAMDYTDNTQKLYIHLEKGVQTLNGAQAEQFARFRNDGLGDIGRVQRQQALLKALRAQVSNPLMIARIPGILRAMQKYIDTNLSFEEMLALVNFGLKLEQKDFKMVLLPGRFSDPKEFRASYWIMDTAGRDRVLKEYFNVGEKLANEGLGTDLRIAVQNVSDHPAAAQQMVEALNNLGYRNAFITESGPEVLPQSQIVVQGGQLQAATSLQRSLQFGSVEAASTGDLDSDLTIRVGNDWAPRPATP
jgi:polyisoprenyl-teichoic acid--peptidoglycan teichoic acid transferase